MSSRQLRIYSTTHLAINCITLYTQVLLSKSSLSRLFMKADLVSSLLAYCTVLYMLADLVTFGRIRSLVPDTRAELG